MSFHRVMGLLVCVGALNLAQAQEAKPQVKRVPAPQTSAASGKEMFNAYCASCHGAGAKGDGPAASALKSKPADLTLLAKDNGGTFPANRIMSILRGQATVSAHGNKDMPVWGPVFWHMSQGHEAQMQQRIANLTHYLETLQAK
jgi:mono/diheme cytochrome c family protein